jgi:diguanylate cyclase (GGDEF)-like protein
VLFLDLDDFGQVNDSAGQSAGDQLLQSVAQRLTRCVRLTDAVARQAEFRPAMGQLGGDSFLLLLTNIDHVNSVAMVAQRILRELGKEPSPASASIGISLYPEDGEDVETLINNADTAMYHAKTSDKGLFCFYTSEMEAQTRDRLGLREALARSELSLSYLPAMTLDDEEVVALEPLPSWCHPKQGMIGPELLRWLAAQTGLANVLDRWVLEAGGQQARLWGRKGMPPTPVVVPLGSQSLSPHSLMALRGVLKDSDVDALRIAVGAVMVDQPGPYLPELLAGLRLGLVLDDFGAGPFAIRTLVQLPLKMIWLGPSLTEGVTSNADDRETVRAVVALAHALGCQVVARGVATEEQRKALIELGCTAGQGPLLSHQVAVEDVAALPCQSSGDAGDNEPLL